MRTSSEMIATIGRETGERKQLEGAWAHAWEARARAAQAGDYAEAERWYRRATLLGAQLQTAETVACAG